MEKFIKKYEAEGLDLDDITGHLGVIFSSASDFDDEAEMEDLKDKAWRYLYRVYEIACECRDDKEL